MQFVDKPGPILIQNYVDSTKKSKEIKNPIQTFILSVIYQKEVQNEEVFIS